MHPLLPTPLRHSLVGQCAQAIRKGIESKIWIDHLPGERTLSERLRVSRPTLRKALSVLEKEGLIQVSQGKRRKILQSQRATKTALVNPRVGVLIGTFNNTASPSEMFLINQIKDPLHEAGFGIEIFTLSALCSARPEHTLKNLTANTAISAWILIATTQAVQQWFAQHAYPAVVVGSCTPDIHLPSIDLDYRALCRHAAGYLISKGHRALGLVIPTSNLTGDIASEAGFQEAVDSSRQLNIRTTYIRHDGTIDHLCLRLQQTMSMKSAPTALLVAKPLHLLTTYSYLSSQGYRIPNNISLVSRDYEPYLNQIVPALACYRFKRKYLTAQLAQVAIQLATSGQLPQFQRKLTPDFDPGDSIRTIKD